MKLQSLHIEGKWVEVCFECFFEAVYGLIGSRVLFICQTTVSKVIMNFHTYVYNMIFFEEEETEYLLIYCFWVFTVFKYLSKSSISWALMKTVWWSSYQIHTTQRPFAFISLWLISSGFSMNCCVLRSSLLSSALPPHTFSPSSGLIIMTSN